MKKMFFRLVQALLITPSLLAFLTGCGGGTNYMPSSKEDSDWLLLFYFDADSNLNDSMFSDLTNVQRALSELRNEDGSAKSGRPTVRAVALWDGCSEAEASKNNATRLHPDGILLELGAMDSETWAKLESDDVSWFIS